MKQKIQEPPLNALTCAKTYELEEIRRELLKIFNTNKIKSFFEELTEDKNYLLKNLYTLTPTSYIFTSTNN